MPGLPPKPTLLPEAEAVMHLRDTQPRRGLLHWHQASLQSVKRESPSQKSLQPVIMGKLYGLAREVKVLPCGVPLATATSKLSLLGS